jgi:hypothetical protein
MLAWLRRRRAWHEISPPARSSAHGRYRALLIAYSVVVMLALLWALAAAARS